jgi:hypothetical protein
VCVTFACIKIRDAEERGERRLVKYTNLLLLAIHGCQRNGGRRDVLTALPVLNTAYEYSLVGVLYVSKDGMAPKAFNTARPVTSVC